MDHMTDRALVDLLTGTEQLLRSAKPGEDGILRLPPGAEGLDLAVSAASLPRAMALVRTFFRKATAVGITIRTEPRLWKPRQRTVAVVQGEDLAIRLHEHRRQRTHQPTAAECVAAKRNGFLTPPKWDLGPSGVLSLEAKDAQGSWTARTWTDRRRARLEEQLDAVIVGLVEMAAALKQDRQRREEERLAAVERERRAALECERQRQEQEWAERLLADAEAWRESRVLRRYVQAMTAHVLVRGSDASRLWLEGWRLRALQVADQIDPLDRIDAAIAALGARR